MPRRLEAHNELGPEHGYMTQGYFSDFFSIFVRPNEKQHKYSILVAEKFL
jgi:hypothetical protein